jgi:hypothetical protein
VGGRDREKSVGLGMVVHACIPATQGVELGESWSKVSLGKNMRPYPKNKINAKGQGVCLRRECLPSKCKALSSIPVTATHKKSKIWNILSSQMRSLVTTWGCDTTSPPVFSWGWDCGLNLGLHTRKASAPQLEALLQSSLL